MDYNSTIKKIYNWCFGLGLVILVLSWGYVFISGGIDLNQADNVVFMLKIGAVVGTVVSLIALLISIFSKSVLIKKYQILFSVILVILYGFSLYALSFLLFLYSIS